MMRNLQALLLTVAMAGAGCVGSATKTMGPDNDNTTGGSTPSTAPTGTSSGDPGNTFSHENDDTVDPFQVLAEIEQQGPPEISTRMHSCGKMKYATVGNVLSDLGIDPTKGNATSAAGLYMSGAGALGQPIYSNRIPESATLSTAGAVRLYDIFVAATPAIVTAMPTLARCMVAGAATNMFDSSGACTSAGITCLTGAPAAQAQIDLCTNAVQSNSTDMVGSGSSAMTVGQVVAVASLLAAAHSCE